MPTPLEKISRKLSGTPLLAVALCFCFGILLADNCNLQTEVAIIGFLIATAIAFARKEIAPVLIAAMLAGGVAISLRRGVELKSQTPLTMEVKVGRKIKDTPGRAEYHGRIVAYTESGKRHRTATTVRLCPDSSLHIKTSERLLLHQRITPYKGKYMMLNGVSGRIFLRQGDIIERRAEPQSFAQRLNEKASQRIDALGLNTTQEAIIKAISIGQKEHISSPLRESFTRAGGAHLLAVSGLHTGFVFLIFNLLLLPLAALREGQILRSIGVIIAIWIFAAVAAFSPSVVRAALMFSLFQVGLSLSSHHNSQNALCAAALIMLMWDARTIYDAGFLLSTLAVGAITEWGGAIFSAAWFSANPFKDRGLQKRHPILYYIALLGLQATRWCIGTITISLVASLATMPLAAWLFGQTSLWSILTAPLLIPLCGIAVCSTLIWILLPAAPLAPIAEAIICRVADAMYLITQWCSQMGVLSADYRISGYTCIAIYLAFILFTLHLWSRRRPIRG